MSEIPDDIMQTATTIAAPRHLTPRSQDLAKEIGFAILHERQRHAEVMEEVRKVLESSDALLKRLMHVHVAPDECTSHVADSQRWFYDNGGTLACLADQFEAIRALLSRLEESVP